MPSVKQVPHAPNRNIGEGPFERLIIRGVTMIDGSGTPPDGPVDIVVEGNKIKEIVQAGLPESALANAKVIDAAGMYVMPGFVDTHAHIGGVNQGVPAEYVHKLWLAHGVTTVRDPGSFNGADWTIHEKERSEKNEIVAPRIYAYTCPRNWDKPLTPDNVPEFVQWAIEKGFDGFKIINRWNPDTIVALLEEAKKYNLGTMAHISQTTAARMDALQAARAGLGSLEHWYGLPEAMFADRSVQHFPAHYNYSNEYHRFSQSGRLWKQAAPPHSDKWNAVMDELIELDFTMNPTFAIYEASRDAARAQTADYHEEYTYPSLWNYYQPDPTKHGSFFTDWTTQDEIEWKENYRLWMAFINEYKNRGGRICTGSDSGFIYKTYGFDFIREFELLQEAGFHPLEVIRAATLKGAELLSKENNVPMEFGVIQPGYLADLVLVKENPLHNFKTLYGNGALRLNRDTGVTERVGGVSFTIKDGIIYDAKALLEDVKEMVRKAK